MFERFTVEAREVVVRARHEARQLRHSFIGTEHLLLALLDEDAGVAYTMLHEAGVDRERVRADIERLVGSRFKILTDDDAVALRTIGIDLETVLARIEESFGPAALEPPQPASRRGLLRRKPPSGARFSRRAKKVLELSLREAIRLGHNYIGSEHILLGLLREGEGLAAKILTDAGIPLIELRQRTLAALRKAA